jgi:hypothetical protein
MNFLCREILASVWSNGNVIHGLHCLLQCCFSCAKVMAIYFINGGILWYDGIPMKENEISPCVILER